MSYFLEGLVGCSRDERIQLVGARMTIGRSIESSIQIVSPLVSRYHAVLLFQDNHWIVKDVKSINGVYVNDTKLPTEGICILNEKDIISLGPPNKTEFRYCFCKGIVDSSENERPCKIRKNENIQSIPDVCAEKNYENLISVENVVNSDDHLHIGAECTVSTSTENEAVSVESQTRDKTRSSADNISNKNLCKNFKNATKATKCSNLTSESNNASSILCSSINGADSENLKQTVNSLRQLLAAKEKEQRDLEDQLLRAEAKLVEKPCESEKQDKENEGNSVQEKIKGEVLQQVGDIMESELICGICTELFVEAVTLNCSHTFCKFCIKRWKQKKNICPMCRSHIKTETQAIVLDNFIGKMVENLSDEMKEYRKRLTEERCKTNSKSGGPSHSDKYDDCIVINDSNDYDSDSSDNYSDSSIEGMPWAYYGGYGRCYNCGRRGHWVNGCPDM